MGNQLQVIGIGCDIVEVGRIADAVHRHENFLERHFTQEERDYFQQFRNFNERVAGHFAAKEAVAKALGWGIRSPLDFSSISIYHDERGRPELILLRDAKARWPSIVFQLTISHTSQCAMAVVLASKLSE